MAPSKNIKVAAMSHMTHYRPGSMMPVIFACRDTFGGDLGVDLVGIGNTSPYIKVCVAHAVMNHELRRGNAHSVMLQFKSARFENQRSNKKHQ